MTVRVSANLLPKETNPNDILVELSQAIRLINTQYAILFSVKEAQLLKLNCDLNSTTNFQSKVDDCNNLC